MGCGERTRDREQQRSACLFLLIALLATIEADQPHTSGISSETDGLRKGQNWAGGEGFWRTGERNQSASSSSSSNGTGGPPSPISAAADRPAGNTLLADDRRTRRRMSGEEKEVGDEAAAYSRPDSIVRRRKLYSRCSSKHLRIYGSRVDSLALPDDIYSELRFETRGAGSLVTIQGSSSRNFLCFNKKGRIAIKHSGRSRRCLFHEIYSLDHYTEFRSAANGSWWLGFGRRGQRLDGQRWTRSRRLRRCFQFLKIDPNVGSGRVQEEADDEYRLHGSNHLGLVNKPHHGRRRPYHGAVPRLRHSFET